MKNTGILPDRSRGFGCIVSLAVLLATVSCRQNDFEITGTVTGSDTGCVVLTDDMENKLDSIRYENGTFVLGRHFGNERFITIYVTDDASGNCLSSRILADDSPMTLTLDFDSNEIGLQGDALNEEYIKYLYFMHEQPQFDMIRHLSRYLFYTPEEDRMETEEEIRGRIDRTRDTLFNAILSFQDDSRRSRAAAALIWEEFLYEDPEVLQSAVSLFDQDYKDSYYLEKLREKAFSSFGKVDVR